MYSDVIYTWHSSLVKNFTPKQLLSQSDPSILTLRKRIGDVRFHGLNQKHLSFFYRWYFPVIFLKSQCISLIEMLESIHLYWGQAPKPSILSFLLNFVRKSWFLPVYDSSVLQGFLWWQQSENEALTWSWSRFISAHVHHNSVKHSSCRHIVNNQFYIVTSCHHWT